MGAAFGGGNCITVGLDEPVARRGPIDRPFHFARGLKALLKINNAAKGLFGIGGCAVKRFIKVIAQSAREMKGRLGRGFTVVNFGFPANFYTAKKIGFGTD